MLDEVFVELADNIAIKLSDMVGEVTEGTSVGVKYTNVEGDNELRKFMHPNGDIDIILNKKRVATIKSGTFATKPMGDGNQRILWGQEIIVYNQQQIASGQKAITGKQQRQMRSGNEVDRR